MKNGNIKRAIAYTRVSTDEQAKEGLSLNNQEERIKAYAISQGLALAEVYRDEGVSAKNTRRPELERLLNDVREGKVGRILVYRLDRLTRSMKDLYNLLDQFRAKEVGFRSVTEDFATDTPVGKVVLGILGLLAEWERDVIGTRIKDALGYKRARKEWCGRPPYGFKILSTTDHQGNIIKDKHLTIDEAQAGTVRVIFKARAQRHSLTKIIAILQARGINGRQWSTAGLWQILRNRSYTGNGTHEAIVSKKLFGKVQEVR
jgi:site-specific DNA recombinase